jgi:hypothetical protein
MNHKARNMVTSVQPYLSAYYEASKYVMKEGNIVNGHIENNDGEFIGSYAP